LCIILNVKVNVQGQQSLYKPGQALRVAESWGSQISRQSAHEDGTFVRRMHRPHLPPRKYSWYSFLLEAALTSKAIFWPEGLYQWKIPLEVSGIEAMSFQLAVQCIIQLCQCMPLINKKCKIIIHSYQYKNKRNISHSVRYIIQYLQWLDNNLMCDKNYCMEWNACVTIYTLNADLKFDITFWNFKFLWYNW